MLAVASAASIGFAAFAAPYWMWAVAPMIALFTAAKAGRRAAILVAALAYAAYLLVTLVFAERISASPRPPGRTCATPCCSPPWS